LSSSKKKVQENINESSKRTSLIMSKRKEIIGDLGNSSKQINESQPFD
jgi:hypothetical protein